MAFHFAYSRGVLIADTKFELGRTLSGVWTMADEILTPDSSRLWDLQEWLKTRGQSISPTSWDKQSVREHGKKIETPFGITGINTLKPENPEHVAFVHSVQIPSDVTGVATERYTTIFSRIVEMPLDRFQRQEMGAAT